VEVEEEVETVAEAPLEAVVAVVAVVDLLLFESFGMYLVNPVLSSLC